MKKCLSSLTLNFTQSVDVIDADGGVPNAGGTLYRKNVRTSATSAARRATLAKLNSRLRTDAPPAAERTVDRSFTGSLRRKFSVDKLHVADDGTMMKHSSFRAKRKTGVGSMSGRFASHVDWSDSGMRLQCESALENSDREASTGILSELFLLTVIKFPFSAITPPAMVADEQSKSGDNSPESSVSNLHDSTVMSPDDSLSRTSVWDDFDSGKFPDL